jgi:hypothetical protein
MGNGGLVSNYLVVGVRQHGADFASHPITAAEKSALHRYQANTVVRSENQVIKDAAPLGC